MPLSIPDIISIAKISEYLAADDIAKGSLFGTRIAPKTPRILYMERVAVEGRYNLDPSDTTLTLTSNYLYSLCRGYNLKAQGILSTGGGGAVSPISPASAPTPIQFTVSASSMIPTGGTTVTISSFLGFNLLLVRGGIPQTTVNDGDGGTYYSWDKSLAQLTIFPAANLGELFQLYPF